MASLPRRPLFLSGDQALGPSTPAFVRDGQARRLRVRPLFGSDEAPEAVFEPTPVVLDDGQFEHEATNVLRSAHAAVALPASPPPPVVLPVELARRFTDAVLRVDDLASRIETHAAAEAVELGLLVARTLLHDELSHHPDKVLGIVREALQKLGESSRYTIRLHPDELAAVRTAAGHGLLGESGAEQVRVESDPSLGRGDCIIDGDPGRVDSRLDDRLDRLGRMLRERLTSPREPSA